MNRLFILALAALISGCVSSEPIQPDPDPTLVVDPDRPDPSNGDVVTGPAVGPDLDATTAAAPRLVEGEWWRIVFETTIDRQRVELVRVVANVTEDGYTIGMPHEGWIKEAIAYHSPGFGDVARNLSYHIHNEWFEPLRWPLKQGDKWTTRFVGSTLIATVDQADQYTANISFRAPPGPTTPLTNLITGGNAPAGMWVLYDARVHEIVKMRSGLGTWSVVEHGYDFEGWTTVPRGEHTAILYGALGPQTQPGQAPFTRTIKVEGGFNRMTLLHMIQGITPGAYRIRSVTPEGKEFITESTTQPMMVKFYEAYDPDGTWLQEDRLIGAGATFNMGIAYHQYDIRLPDGQRRADHAHPVIR